jgi:outer membrane protein OmpA-like peptidoglycan-associated protein
MNKVSLGVLLVSIALNSYASEFEGAYVGANLGSNTAAATALADKKSTYLGLKAGYNWDWDDYLVGVEGFADAHSDSYTSSDIGMDARLGLPMSRWMPYAKLGLAVTTPGTRLHGGVGVEYKMTDRLTVNAEWTRDSKDDGGVTKKNNNISLGLNLYFDASPAKAQPVALATSPVIDQAAADRAAADRAAADRAAADRAAADRAAAEKAAAEKAAAEKAAAEKAAQLKYKSIFTDKPVTLEGTSFASGSAKLNPAAGAQLDQVVEFAEAQKETSLQITGYTDDRGDAQKNVALSAARAEAVKAYLVGKGVAAERLITRGLGSANPVADNKTAEGRAMNRRVEITSVVKEEKKVLVQ